MIRLLSPTVLKRTLLLAALAGLFAVAMPAPAAQAGLLDYFKKDKAGEQAAPASAAPAASGLPQAQAPSAPVAPTVSAPAPVAQPAVDAAKAAANAKQQQAAAKSGKTIVPKEINAEEFTKMMASKNPPYVIDVRDQVEFMDFHMKGAINIPLGSIAGAIPTLPRDRDVVVYCRTGRRSEIAQKAMIDFGMTNVLNLSGGIFTWASLNKCDLKKKEC